MSPTWSIKPKKTKVLEAEITKAIKEILKKLKIPFFKHWSGPFSKEGVSDIIGCLPGTGRALFLEIKKPGEVPTDSQWKFLDKFNEGDAVCFYVDNAWDVVRKLAGAKYQPAIDMLKMMPGGQV